MHSPVIVLGAGGHAKVLINVLQLCSVEILGIMDSNPVLIGQQVLGVPIIGTLADLTNRSPKQVRLVNGVGSIDLPRVRHQLFDQFKRLDFVFSTVVHPSAVVAADAQIGEGSQIMAGAILQPGVCLGDNVIVNTGASLDHDCSVGSHTHIAPRVTLSGHVQVGMGAHLGTGASIIQGVRVGEGSLVGAGSVVLRDIPAAVRAYGCPAKVVGPCEEAATGE